MNLEHLISVILPPIISTLELIGIFIVVVASCQAFFGYMANTFARKSIDFKEHLSEGLVTALEFKLAAEVLKTVLIREFSELLMIGALIALRALLTLLIRFEIKSRAKNNNPALL